MIRFSRHNISEVLEPINPPVQYRTADDIRHLPRNLREPDAYDPHKITAAKAAIAAGTCDTPARFNIAADRLLGDLNRTAPTPFKSLVAEMLETPERFRLPAAVPVNKLPERIDARQAEEHDPIKLRNDQDDAGAVMVDGDCDGME